MGMEREEILVRLRSINSWLAACWATLLVIAAICGGILGAILAKG